MEISLKNINKSEYLNVILCGLGILKKQFQLVCAYSYLYFFLSFFHCYKLIETTKITHIQVKLCPNFRNNDENLRNRTLCTCFFFLKVFFLIFLIFWTHFNFDPLKVVKDDDVSSTGSSMYFDQVDR